MKSKKNRIWELDAFRGVCILAVVALHLLFDLKVYFGLRILDHPVMQAVNTAVGISFVVLSGLCVTLGSCPLRRGLEVFFCAMAITAVTWSMAKLNFLHPGMVIRFGVLHLLGVCMLLWPLFKKLPTGVLAVLGLAIILLGHWFETLTVTPGWLFPLGLVSRGFSSGDYFPLAPHLGWFFLGAVLGRMVYKEKRSIFPDVSKSPAFLCWCGRHSLLIYLVHQPVLYGIVSLLT